MSDSSNSRWNWLLTLVAAVSFSLAIAAVLWSVRKDDLHQIREERIQASEIVGERLKEMGKRIDSLTNRLRKLEQMLDPMPEPPTEVTR
jgi:hypothetical protein